MRPADTYFRNRVVLCSSFEPANRTSRSRLRKSQHLGWKAVDSRFHLDRAEVVFVAESVLGVPISVVQQAAAAVALELAAA